VGIVQRFGLAFDRLDYFRMAMSRVAAPQAGHCIQQLFPVVRVAVHSFCAVDHARMLFEVAVAGEGHPVRLEVR
jgi:hypothetical protein